MDIERETIKTVPCPSGAPHTSDFNIVCVLKERQGAFKASIMLDNEISNKHTGLLKQGTQSIGRDASTDNCRPVS